MEQVLIALAGVVVGGFISFFVAWQNARWAAQREERAESRKQRDSLVAELEILYGQILHLLRAGSVKQDNTVLWGISREFGTPVERLTLRATTEIYNQYQETVKSLTKLADGIEAEKKTQDDFDKQYWHLSSMMKEHLESLRKGQALH